MADGLQEVGLPQTGTTINEERVVALPRVLDYGLCGGIGELVALTFNEGIKGVFGVKERQAGLLRPGSAATTIG